MEHENSGFAGRIDQRLRKAVTSPVATVAGKKQSFEIHEAQRHTLGAASTKNTPNNSSRGFIPSTKEGVVTGGAASPETGSDRLRKEQHHQQQQQPSKVSASASAVDSDTPNIPNVVEYHLKVKSPIPKDAVSKNITRPAIEMKKERVDPTLSEDRRKDLTSRLSKLSVDNNVFEGSSDLPQVFQVKYLGSHDARGLWGIKHTRMPVDNMVAAAKALPPGTILPFVKLVISEDGVALLPLGKKRYDAGISQMYPIESISYGVQDLVYTRVFSMIVVRETDNFRQTSPFECHGFVCESKHHARQMTYALAAAFQIYSHHVKTQCENEDAARTAKKTYALELGNSNEMAAQLTLQPEESKNQLFFRGSR